MHETAAVHAPYFETCFIPPGNPYAEYLESEGLAGELLVPYLHRLALLKEDWPTRTGNRDPGEDELNRGELDRLVDTDGFCVNKNVSSLTDFFYDVLGELKAHPDLYTSSDIDWSKVGNSMLNRASSIERTDENEQIRRELLSSSTIALLLAEDPEDRLDFVWNVYALGLASDMHDALDNSPISSIESGYNRLELSSFASSTIMPKRSIRRVRAESDIFEYDVCDIEKVIELTRNRGSTVGDVHDTMRAIGSQSVAAEGVDPELRWLAQKQTVEPVNVDRYRIDPTKAERYALEEVFVRDQMAEIFPDGDYSKLRNALAASWKSHGPFDYSRLTEDVRATILDLSRPVIAKYECPSGDDIDMGNLTPEQRAAFRFVQLRNEARKYEKVLRFVDRTIFGPVSGFNDTIFAIPGNGADIPDRSVTLVRFANNEAKRLFKKTGERVDPEELKVAILLRRNQLMKLAAIHIDSFGRTRADGGVNPQHVYTPSQGEPDVPMKLFRRDDGPLDFKVPIFRVIKEGSPSSARLACVALKVNLEKGDGKNDSDLSEPKKVNVIDALTEVVVEEAFARGMIGIWYEPEE